MIRFVALLVSHTIVLVVGFALGIYFLPILTAPDSPETAVLEQKAQNAQYSAEFNRDLRGSDFLHWGEGKVSISPEMIVHQGRLAPGPDYKVYLVSEFVEHEDEFLPIKDNSVLIGDVKTFDGFLLNVPEGVDIETYNTVLVWCETFGEFISAAKYR
ncbi:DM13 domain-containing protein [Pseudovibrio sp. Ad26]|uniref:DM13 domain-containing protein n=1 Tax=Pseudovibrio sp. Ad26 TaxID=989410 RepID=UPI0007AEC48A|nr:DM13 domain-containing protein [Pseudovibrio sp. Ad26]KZL16898.1 Electron transfer DM13 [Pseudovibrio sp. Ad26]